MLSGVSMLCQFQSTHPVRGGTRKYSAVYEIIGISIHPPREGWDVISTPKSRLIGLFQSTHPVRGGTTDCT